MAIHDSEPALYPNPKGLREAIAYWHAIDALIGRRTPLTGYESEIEITNRTQREVNSSSPPPAISNKGVIGRAYSDFFLPLQKLDWLKKNERICYWIWMRVAFGSDTPNTIDTNGWRHEYHHFNGLTRNPSSHQDRFDLLVKYIDLVPVQNIQKLLWLDQLKRNWLEKSGSAEEFKWLGPTTETSASWIWDYVSSSPAQMFWAVGATPPPNKDEKVKAAIAIIDFWSPPKDTFKLFLINMKKAWSQKKFRDKQGDRKTYSFSLRPTSRELLKKFAKDNNCKPNEQLERLIDDYRLDEIKTHFSTAKIAEQLHNAERLLTEANLKISDQAKQIEYLQKKLNEAEMNAPTNFL